MAAISPLAEATRDAFSWICSTSPRSPSSMLAITSETSLSRSTVPERSPVAIRLARMTTASMSISRWRSSSWF